MRHALLWLPTVPWLPWLPWVALVALAVTEPATAGVSEPIVHERIPPDAREDLAMHVALDGDLPAALQTPSGVLSAPDPRAPASSSDTVYGAAAPEDSSYRPDKDTRRPEVSRYDDPFTPSTAPFKRVDAYDAVAADYQLSVRDKRLSPMVIGASPGIDDDAFYADLVVDLAPDRPVRIPSVGPGARIVRARLGVGVADVAFAILHDGADNWFVQENSAAAPVRARLVMELAIPRAAFGGQSGNPSWGELPMVTALPDNVASDAAHVRAVIGVSRAQRPREALARLVQYFRGFTDSDEPPHGHGNVYLDLALSKKGVCRHRAFAFMVTAQSLGIPARFVANEAHAWVEVHDGTLWRRIDLGGAGHMDDPAPSSMPERAVYQPPPDAFAWPQNAEPGEDMVSDARARAAASMGSSPGAGSSTASTPASSASAAPGAAASSSASASAGGSASPGLPDAGGGDHDDRPPSVLTLAVPDGAAHRGLPMTLRGDVHADGEPCAHLAVELWLREPVTQRMLVLGTLATGDDGRFAGGIVVPGSTPLGDYDVLARTAGDARCGSGSSR